MQTMDQIRVMNNVTAWDEVIDILRQLNTDLKSDNDNAELRQRIGHDWNDESELFNDDQEPLEFMKGLK